MVLEIMTPLPYFTVNCLVFNVFQNVDEDI